ncbi:hypothetical protein K1T71_004106 [Dendrolimus kikuchii]|uniref:Uncharacterized protein n=1 Tax=Dendrolimus kikuchii TaxID=765133 RepID=A0ACC1DAU3_9NEOP|nr:hypothetical protein K1T71_004106 [Dendrolimus kikuchii]
MLLLLICLFAFAAARPATYDQRQDGEINVQADVKNIMFIIAIPQKLPSSIYEILLAANRGNLQKANLQERSDYLMEAFVEPNTPYQVEIGTSKERFADSDGTKIEVVIAGKRRLDSDSDVQGETDEMKLIGATEQCGPDRERDPVTLTCRSTRAEPQASEASPEKKEEKIDPQPTPEVVSS